MVELRLTRGHGLTDMLGKLLKTKDTGEDESVLDGSHGRSRRDPGRGAPDELVDRGGTIKCDLKSRDRPRDQLHLGTRMARQRVQQAEVIEHGANGLLADFFDQAALARTVAQVLADPVGHRRLGEAARKTVQERYDLRTRCLPRLLALLGPPEAGAVN